MDVRQRETDWDLTLSSTDESCIVAPEVLPSYGIRLIRGRSQKSNGRYLAPKAAGVASETIPRRIRKK